MATTYPLPSVAVIDVGATSTPATVLNGVISYNRNSARARTDQSVFQSATRLSNFGPRTLTLTFVAIYSPDDPGQAVLRAAEIANTVAYCKFLIDGTNGSTAGFLVGTEGFTGDPDTRGRITYELAIEPSITEVTVGAGY